tara:strand:+ start:360 stop:1673 length:1314 start_codon:yes stop_codon:yes gene_type:complete
MKLFFLLSVLFLITNKSNGQNLELVWYKEKPPVDILYNHDTDHIKLSHWFQNSGDPFISLRASVTNQGASTVTGLRLKADMYDIYWSKFGTLYSHSIDSIQPLDTLGYGDLKTDSVKADHAFWQGGGSLGGYRTQRFVISLETDSGTLGPLDTLALKPVYYDPMVSTDFGGRHAYVGSSNLGTDVGAVAWLVPISATYNNLPGDCGFLSDPVLEIPLSPGSVNGGDVDLEVYDSADFDPIAGIGSGALLSQTFAVTITQTSDGPKLFLFPWNFNQALQLNQFSTVPRYVWVVLSMYSNRGNNPIDIACDTSVFQPFPAVAYFNANYGLWVDSDTLGYPALSPALTIHWGENVSTEEPVRRTDIEVYPNPTEGSFFLRNIEAESLELTVYDADGREIIHIQEAREGEEVNLKDQPKGIYSVQLEEKGEVLFRKKIVKR